MNSQRKTESDFSGHRMVLSEGKVTKQHLEPMLARHLVAYDYCAEFVAGKSVLEIGCGTGYGSYLLAERAKSVTAIDISDAAIGIARESYIKENLIFEVGDAGDLLAFKDDSYDIVFSSQCIEHVAAQETFVANVFRILRKEGIFIVITPNAETYITGLNPFHVREFRKDELQRLLSGYFEDTRIYGIFGNENVMKWLDSHYKLANLLIKLGVLRIRKMFPDRLYTYMFQRMTAITESIMSFKRAGGAAISVVDFRIDDRDVEKSIDLLGVCRKGAGKI